MAEGRTNHAISEELSVTERAVERHVTSIFGKLGLHATGHDHRRVLAVLTYLHGERVVSGVLAAGGLTRDAAQGVDGCDRSGCARRCLLLARYGPVVKGSGTRGHPAVGTGTTLIVTADIKQRDLVVASILAVPGKDAGERRRPKLEYTRS